MDLLYVTYCEFIDALCNLLRNCVINCGFNNYEIDRTTLNKTIISRELSGTDINYLLNLNAFSQSLGFNVSQQFKATVFGSSINWTEKTIDETNNTLEITFSIADLNTQSFVDTTTTFTIEIFTEYTPYSLAYELSRIIKRGLSNGSIFTYNQDVEPVVYDSLANIFYIQFILHFLKINFYILCLL